MENDFLKGENEKNMATGTWHRIAGRLFTRCAGCNRLRSLHIFHIDKDGTPTARLDCEVKPGCGPKYGRILEFTEESQDTTEPPSDRNTKQK